MSRFKNADESKTEYVIFYKGEVVGYWDAESADEAIAQCRQSRIRRYIDCLMTECDLKNFDAIERT